MAYDEVGLTNCSTHADVRVYWNLTWLLLRQGDM